MCRTALVVNTEPPKLLSLTRTVEQPGRIEAYQQTPLFSKIAGYVDTVKVDIGACVCEGDILAELRVPELDQEYLQKTAAVEQATSEIDQAKQAAKAAEANYETTQSLVKEAEAVPSVPRPIGNVGSPSMRPSRN